MELLNLYFLFPFLRSSLADFLGCILIIRLWWPTHQGADILEEIFLISAEKLGRFLTSPPCVSVILSHSELLQRLLRHNCLCSLGPLPVAQPPECPEPDTGHHLLHRTLLCPHSQHCPQVVAGRDLSSLQTDWDCQLQSAELPCQGSWSWRGEPGRASCRGCGGRACSRQRRRSGGENGAANMWGGCPAEDKTDNYWTGENERLTLIVPSRLSQILANFQNLYPNCSHTEKAFQKDELVCWASESRSQNHCETRIHFFCVPHKALLSWDRGAGQSVLWAWWSARGQGRLYFCHYQLYFCSLALAAGQHSWPGSRRPEQREPGLDRPRPRGRRSVDQESSAARCWPAPPRCPCQTRCCCSSWCRHSCRAPRTGAGAQWAAVSWPGWVGSHWTSDYTLSSESAPCQFQGWYPLVLASSDKSQDRNWSRLQSSFWAQHICQPCKPWLGQRQSCSLRSPRCKCCQNCLSGMVWGWQKWHKVLHFVSELVF